MTEQTTNQNSNAISLPESVYTVSFHAVQEKKQTEAIAQFKEIGAEYENYKDSKGNERIRRKPVAVKVAPYTFTPEQTEAIAQNTIREAIRNTLQEAHFSEVDEESLKELLDAELFSGGSGSGIKLSKDEREELAKGFEQFLVEAGVAEQGRNALVPVLKFGASDSKMKVFGDFDAQTERVQKACSAIITRLKAFKESDQIEGMELAFTEAVISRVEEYAEKGPAKKKEEKDIIDVL